MASYPPPDFYFNNIIYNTEVFNDTSTSSGTLSGNGNLITNLNYNNITNPPDLNQYVSSNTFNPIPLEKEFPPTIWNSITTEDQVSFLGISAYHQTLTLGTDTYEIYTSSKYTPDPNLVKQYLFDKLYDTINTSAWALNSYTAGVYNGANYIVNGYNGDWIVIKLPIQINLTKFSFSARTGWLTRAPGKWRCYGSTDGITFTEIVEASNDTTNIGTTPYNNAVNHYTYEKVLTTASPLYSYIGFTFNALSGSDVLLNFMELRIFGTDGTTYLNYPFDLLSSNQINTLIANNTTNGNYLPLSGGTLTNAVKPVLTISDGINTLNLSSQELTASANLNLTSSGSIFFQTNNANRLSLNTNGRFDIYYSAFMNTNENVVFVVDGGANNRLGFLKQSGQLPKIASSQGSDIIFTNLTSGDLSQTITAGTAFNDLMTIKSTGNIGIGLTNPTNKLEVNGNVKATTFLDGNGNNITNTTQENQLNMSTIYSFPPQVYRATSLSSQLTINTLGNGTAFYKTFSVDGDFYGTGKYTAYYSSYYVGGSLSAIESIFNYIENSTEAGHHWATGTAGNYTAGVYNGTNYLKSDYLGDWVLIKLPQYISLSSFSFTARSNSGDFRDRAPGKWKCYGSIDGVNFIEITEASNTATKIGTTAYDATTYKYTKTLNNITPLYNYIGFVVNELAGTSATLLNFVELRLNGRASKYLTSGNTKTDMIISDKTTLAIPSVGTYGGNGDRIVLYKGTDTSTPYSIGVNNSELWLNTGGAFNFYVNGVSKSSIDTNGKISVNNTNTGGPTNGVLGGNGDKFILYQGSVSSTPYSIGVNTSDFWLNSGGSFSFYSNGVLKSSIDANGVVMSKSKIYIDNTDLNVPVNGVMGGIGDKLILRAGDANNAPYSVGVNSSELWLNSGGGFGFYTNKTKQISFDNTGVITSAGLKSKTNSYIYKFMDKFDSPTGYYVFDLTNLPYMTLGDGSYQRMFTFTCTSTTGYVILLYKADVWMRRSNGGVNLATYISQKENINVPTAESTDNWNNFQLHIPAYTGNSICGYIEFYIHNF